LDVSTKKQGGLLVLLPKKNALLGQFAHIKYKKIVNIFL